MKDHEVKEKWIKDILSHWQTAILVDGKNNTQQQQNWRKRLSAIFDQVASIVTSQYLAQHSQRETALSVLAFVNYVGTVKWRSCLAKQVLNLGLGVGTWLAVGYYAKPSNEKIMQDELFITINKRLRFEIRSASTSLSKASDIITQLDQIEKELQAKMRMSQGRDAITVAWTFLGAGFGPSLWGSFFEPSTVAEGFCSAAGVGAAGALSKVLLDSIETDESMSMHV